MGLVTEDDKMPQQICQNCCEQLTSTSNFYDLCHTTQKKFQEQIEMEDTENSAESDVASNAGKENKAPSINTERHKRSSKKPQNILEETSTNIIIKEEVDIFDEKSLEPFPSSPNEEQSLKPLPPLSNKRQSPKTLHSSSNKKRSLEPLHSLSNKEQSPVPLASSSKKPMVRIHCLELLQNESNVPDTLTSSKQSDRLGDFSGSIKVRDLITEEQQETIEACYIKDQITETHNEEVQQNMSIKSKNIIKCKICDSTYLRRDKCEVHIMSHLNIKPYKCTKCNFATVTVSNIRCHVRKSHLKIKPFTCNVCRKQYTTAVLLREHENTHTGERPYKCNACKFSTTSRQSLRNHINVHKSSKVHSDASYKCTKCSNIYKTKHTLNEHLLKHDGIRNYKCLECPKSFFQQSHLAAHKNTHGPSKYECSYCHRKFNRRDNMKAHKKKCKFYKSSIKEKE
ncbi:zinc finger protein Paris-like [Linepithema humile]|uniref:zinc finger protein Paris-like n=1 Tax=Linepithema humile TaxID=83485 RepID=UPI00351EE12C